MVAKLTTCEMKQSELDPCLFIGDTVIAVMYVDDILMCSTDDDYIYHLDSLLRAEGVELELEDDDAGFLGVNRIQGKSMLENKKLSDREECMSSSVGYRFDDRTIVCVIVNRDSNEKQVFKAGDNNVIDETSSAVNTSQREMPMLGIKRRSAR